MNYQKKDNNNNNLLVVLSGVIILVVILVIIFIPFSTNNINPYSTELCYEQLEESLKKQEYKLMSNKLVSLDDTKNVEESISKGIFEIDSMSKIYDFINKDGWDRQKKIRQFTLHKDLIIIIPQINFNLKDWKMISGDDFIEEIEVDADLSIELSNIQKGSHISKTLYDWSRTHKIWEELKLDILQKEEHNIKIIAYHSGCFLAYGLYCSDVRIKELTLIGCPNFFYNPSENIKIYQCLSDLWSRIPIKAHKDFWKNNIYFGEDENYIDLSVFKKFV